MQLVGIPMNGSVSFLQPSVVLETATPGFTVGRQYSIYAMAVDTAPIPPKPYFMCVDDDGHFKVLDAGNVRRV